MPDITFTTPDLTTFTRLDELGLQATGQHISASKTIVRCRVVDPDDWCHQCGAKGIPRDTVTRRLAHTPCGWKPTTLHIRVRRYACSGCGHVWRQDTSKAAAPRAKLSYGGVRWALEGLVVQHLTVARVAQGLAVSWNTANAAVLAQGQHLLINDEHRFNGVQVLGVDEHIWRHTRTGDKYVTVIIDLTAVRDKSGPARLLDMVEGRSKAVFKTWLAHQSDTWRQQVKVVAMDGFTGFKTAANEELPHAVTVMDPFHVVRLASEALDECRRRVQHEVLGRRGRSGDPLYSARRTLLTGQDLLTKKQLTRLETLFSDDEYVAVQMTWGFYQEMVAAYRNKNSSQGRGAMVKLITTLASNVPRNLTELIKLGRTLKRRAVDILAYFDHRRTSNGPTEAINGRLEHLRGSALGFRNLTNYIARSLLETGGFRPRLHSGLG